MHLLNETGCVNEWCYGVHVSDFWGRFIEWFCVSGFASLVLGLPCNVSMKFDVFGEVVFSCLRCVLWGMCETLCLCFSCPWPVLLSFWCLGLVSVSICGMW